MHDRVDMAILAALQENASLTNGALSELINLSPSQCSRRRVALEQSGVIVAYRAQIDAARLGYSIEAYIRVMLTMHSETAAEEFTRYLVPLVEVIEAQAVTGDADYVLRVRTKSLDSLADFIHKKLLTHAAVGQVKSDIVLKNIKLNNGIALN